MAPSPRSGAGSPGGPHSPKARMTDESVALQVQQFLDEWHYSIIASKLGKRWTRTRVLTETLRIFAMNGVEIEEHEHPKLAAMDEKAMILEIVDRMPETLRTDIEGLGAFLTKVLEAVCHVRRVIENKTFDELQEVMSTSDAFVSQELLKQGIIRGAQEVQDIQRCRDTWTKNMNTRLHRLTSSTELAEHASQQLLAVESQLEAFMGGNKEKNTQMLGSLAAKNDKLLMHSAFAAWNGFTIKQVAAGNLRKKYQQMAIDAEDHLVQYREKRILNVRNVLMRKATESDACMLALCVETWGEDIAERKKDGDQKELMLKMQKQLADSAESQKDATKKVMARMSADSDGAMVSAIFAGWLQFHANYAKDRELEDAVKLAEKQFADFQSNQKSKATGVLDRMNASTDSGLMEQMFQFWAAHIKEVQDDRARDAAIGDKALRFQNMRLRQSGNAQGVQTRVNDQVNANLCLRCFGAWQMESKTSRVTKYYTNKIESKRKQLTSVQSLFKSFAQQLEAGLAGVDNESPANSARSPAKDQRRKSGGGSQSGRSGGKSGRSMGQSSSLPDIHGR